jgi:hypothetical protein
VSRAFRTTERCNLGAERFDLSYAAQLAGALLYELRAAASLCRIGGRDARERLARLVARFGSDVDCADRRAARALL